MKRILVPLQPLLKDQQATARLVLGKDGHLTAAPGTVITPATTHATMGLIFHIMYLGPLGRVRACGTAKKPNKIKDLRGCLITCENI